MTCCGRADPTPQPHPTFQFVVTDSEGTTVYESQDEALDAQRADPSSRMHVIRRSMMMRGASATMRE